MASLFQFSIRGLLWAVTILAVGIAALVNANDIWQGLTWWLTLYALTAAILLVVYRRGEKRAFWLGFAIFGWIYLLVLFVSHQSWVGIAPLRYSELLTTQAAQWSHQHLLPESRRLEFVTVQAPQPVDPFGNPGGLSGMSGMPAMAGGGDMMMGGAMPGAMGPGGGMSAMMGSAGGGPMGGVYSVANPNHVPLRAFTHIFHALALFLTAAVGGKTCQIIARHELRSREVA